jgi:O-antigen ligase
MPISIRGMPHSGQLLGGRLVQAALPMGLLAYAAAVFALPVLQTEEQIAFGLLLLVPALLIAVYVVTRALLGDRSCGVIIAVMSIFIMAANFRSRAYDDKSIDWQVGIKLVATALLIGMAVVFLTYAFNRLHLGRLFYAWLLFSVWLIVCSLYSVNPAFALVSSISFLAAYSYAVYMTVWLSRVRAIEVIMLVALLMCVGSIVVYFAVPSMGRMQAWMPGAVFGDTGRMKGLTGTANAIGMLSAVAIGFSVLYYRELGTFGRRIAILLIPSALACLVLSQNRGSMMAIAVAIWFASVCRSNTSFKLVLSVAGALVGGALLMSFSDEIFSMLSRSGSSSEIVTVTGRSNIWAVVIELWAKQPFFGYGHTSSLWVLPSTPALFVTAAHAHNMLLELLFSGGIVLVAIFLYATYVTFVQMYHLGAINEAAVFVFFLTRGLAEPGPFSGVAGFASVGFAMAIALVISKAMDAREESPMARSFSARRAAREPRLSRA